MVNEKPAPQQRSTAEQLEIAELATKGVVPDLVKEALRDWRLAREAADRANRNVLQYAAGLAAVLGIGGGTGGLVAVANSLRSQPAASPATEVLPWLAAWIGGVLVLATLVGLALFIVLIRTYLRRQEWEHKADEHLRRLIVDVPGWFRPKPD